MRKVHDQLAKAILRAVLGSAVQMETNREIRGHILEADIWLEPGPELLLDQAAFGVLGRMLAIGPCLVEPFSGVPRAAEVRSCILKQYSLDHAQRRDAKTGSQPLPPFPGLWIIANGNPASVLQAMNLQRMDGWPNGFYTGRPFDAFHLAVIRQLPRTAETLLLRLLGRGETFAQAIRDLVDVDQYAPNMAGMAAAVLQVLVVFDRDLDQDQLEEDDMEALRDIEAAYKEWEQRVRHEASLEGERKGLLEGERKGLLEGERKGLLEVLQGLCAQHGVELTNERRAQMTRMDAHALERAILAVSATHEWPA